MERGHAFLSDQFGQPLEVGRWYGIRRDCDPPSRCVPGRCDFILRGIALFALENGTILNTQHADRDLRFVLLDNQRRELTQLPSATKRREVDAMARMLNILAWRGNRLRRKQTELMEELQSLLAGVVPEDELLDAAATFIRDHDSHITVETLLEWYSEFLDRPAWRPSHE